MILIPLILVPCVILSITAVALLDRAGVLPHFDGGGGGGGGSGLVERIPRPAIMGALVLMSGWVLAWVVLLLVGLWVLSS